LIYCFIRERSKLRLTLVRLLEPCRYTQGEYDWACEAMQGAWGVPLYIYTSLCENLWN